MRAWQLLSVPFVLTSVASAHPGHPHWVNELTHHMVEMLVVLGCVLVVWRLAGRVGCLRRSVRISASRAVRSQAAATTRLDGEELRRRERP
ncbi:MAG: hypothetical protein KDC87_04820 [Planctomycetes bacterium]|nr:hypothetical protein [Planctomycetota bacterium]